MIRGENFLFHNYFSKIWMRGFVIFQQEHWKNFTFKMKSKITQMYRWLKLNQFWWENVGFSEEKTLYFKNLEVVERNKKVHKLTKICTYAYNILMYFFWRKCNIISFFKSILRNILSFLAYKVLTLTIPHVFLKQQISMSNL